MKKAVIYARYSSNLQSEESIDAQVRYCTQYAQQRGYTILKTYADEAISGSGGKTNKRVQYQQLLRDAQKGRFDVVLIHKYDRIARNVAEHVNLSMRLSQYNIELIAVSQDFGSGNEAKIMKTLMWALSEYYIDNLADETRKGLRENALKGLHNGGYPMFGFDVVDKKYVVNPIEQHYLLKMFQAADSGEGFKELIQEMEEKGIRGRRGKPIRYPQIYELLRNRMCIGEYSYTLVEERTREGRRAKENAIRIPNAVPQLIPTDLFERVQKKMKSRKHVGGKSTYLCSGLVYCSCGAKMHALKSTRKGYTYYSYYCPKKCGAGIVHMEDVDNAAIQYLHALLSDENKTKIIEALREYTDQKSVRDAAYIESAAKEVAKRESQIEGYMKSMASGVLSIELMQDIDKKIRELKKEIEAIKAAPIPEDYSADTISRWLDQLGNVPQREAIQLLIERIDVDKTKTEFSIKSTLNSVVGNIGCGGSDSRLPTILFQYLAYLSNYSSN